MKIRYATQVGVAPPTFALFSNYPKVKIPRRSDLNTGDVRHMVSRTELWLEHQRPALPPPAVRIVDDIGVQLAKQNALSNDEFLDMLIEMGVTVKPDSYPGDVRLSIRTGRKVEFILYLQEGDEPSDDDPPVAAILNQDPWWAYALRDAYNASRRRT